MPPPPVADVPPDAVTTPPPVETPPPAPPRPPPGPRPAPISVAVPAGSSQPAIAARLNAEGITELAAGRATAASAKFREAVARVPEAVYFFNLCLSLYDEGRFDDAMTACNLIHAQAPAAELDAKANAMLDRIRDAAAQQHIELHH
jgi:hypothetical protein